MADVDEEVFGRITAKEIIGASPPAPETREALERELGILLGALDSEADPRGLLERQEGRAALINGRPGAMALAQDKIRIFNEFHDAYTGAIRARLGPGDAGSR